MKYIYIYICRCEPDFYWAAGRERWGNKIWEEWKLGVFNEGEREGSFWWCKCCSSPTRVSKHSLKISKSLSLCYSHYCMCYPWLGPGLVPCFPLLSTLESEVIIWLITQTSSTNYDRWGSKEGMVGSNLYLFHQTKTNIINV